jgi:hypothetical protein
VRRAHCTSTRNGRSSNWTTAPSGEIESGGPRAQGGPWKALVAATIGKGPWREWQFLSSYF